MSDDLLQRIRERDRAARLAALRQQAFHDGALQNWTFDRDDGSSPLMDRARKYVEHWDQARAASLGLRLWGAGGTGKSFFAACVANALLERGLKVRMTHFGRVLNTLGGYYSRDRDRYLDELAALDLLVLDDFGMERGTEYALEQVFPMIVTTNLTLEDLKHPRDLAHQRIYDRILGACAPICFNGKNFRQDQARAARDLAGSLLA